ncbi:MAG: triphosphoribosyl-dephospho-CoA synthase CitG [Lactobacillales bacterium]|jgi:triphosphoribosyl-dephospho-CoA synthase|nr:triphosphoribosyl-dephospho-CoA synthase CitG [Lactobacillales bacterium]
MTIEKLQKKIATLATESLLEEVALAPKPGLVDAIDTGAHRDMDISTFTVSAHALEPYFEEYVRLGYQFEGTPTELFEEAREVGKRAEEDMMKATNEVNTHKGANFSFAIILASIGNFLKSSDAPSVLFDAKSTQTVFSFTKEMMNDIIKRDLEKSKGSSDTYGKKLYDEYGFTGIRGEAMSGFQTLNEFALPILRSTSFFEKEARLLWLLLHLMSKVEDTNLIRRGGIEGWQQVKKEAQELIISCASNEQQLKQQLSKYNKKLIERNLSPGGSADLLALSIFFGKLEKIL